MLIFGHPLIKNALFYHVPSIDAITNTPPSGAIYVTFNDENLDIIQHAKSNNVAMCIEVESIKELILSANLGASFILVPNTLAKQAQEIATEYLFDAKILTAIADEEEIEEFALLGVDGVVLSSAIIKTNS